MSGLGWCLKPPVGCTSCCLTPDLASVSVRFRAQPKFYQSTGTVSVYMLRSCNFAGPSAVAAEPLRNVVPRRKSSVEVPSPPPRQSGRRFTQAWQDLARDLGLGAQTDHRLTKPPLRRPVNCSEIRGNSIERGDFWWHLQLFGIPSLAHPSGPRKPSTPPRDGCCI